MTIKFDNKLISLAKRYADALFDVAQKDKNVDVVFEDLKAVLDAVVKNGDFSGFLIHPVIKIEDKKDAVEKIFKGKIANSVYNLVVLLIENNRFNIFQPILECFEEDMNKSKNIERARVTSAIELDRELKDRLKQKLEAKFKKQMVLDYEVNKEIIAGLIIKIGDKVIDSSVRSKFENMRKQLI